MKATHWKISQKFLDYKTPKKGEFKKPKWVEFCEHFINVPELTMKLYEARQTNSKYITIFFKDQTYKVRFSDHKPIKSREEQGDCDFFVGITHLGVRNTDMAILAVQTWLKTFN